MEYESNPTINVGNLHSQSVHIIKKKYGKILLALLIIMGVTYAVGTVVSVVSWPMMFGAQASIIPFMATMPHYMDGPPDANFYFNYLGRFFTAFSAVYVLMMALSLFAQSAIEPIRAGQRLYMLNLMDNRDVKVEQLFKPFKKFWRFVTCYLWFALWVFLWSLLFIVPGIIKALSYSMMPYLVAQYDDLPVREAMKLSMRITEGYKGKIFFMYFILWAWSLLSVVAAFIICLGPILIMAYAFLWLMPLYAVFEAVMYREIKITAFQNGTLSADDLRINFSADQPSP